MKNLTGFKNRVATMEGILESTLRALEEIDHEELPAKAFQKAHGIVVMEVVKTSFVCAAQGGTGVLLRHDQETREWGPPLAVGMTGVGFGLGLGVAKKRMVFLLTDEGMSKALSSDFSLRLGVQSSWAWGKKGEGDDFAVHIGNKGSANTYGYSTAKGVYRGTTADGMILAPMSAINKAFYGEKLPAKDLSHGRIAGLRVPPCEPLERLQARLKEIVALADSSQQQSEEGQSVVSFDATTNAGQVDAVPSAATQPSLPAVAVAVPSVSHPPPAEHVTLMDDTGMPVPVSPPPEAQFVLPAIFRAPE